MASSHHDPQNFTNTVTMTGPLVLLGPFSPPAGTILDAAIGDSAEISADKQEHRFAVSYSQDTGTDVVSATKHIHVCRAAGALRAATLRIFTAPNGGGLQYTIDVKKIPADSGVATTLLAAVFTIDDPDVNNDVLSAALAADPSLAAGDTIQIVVTASGAGGTQGQGFVITLEIDESGII